MVNITKQLKYVQKGEYMKVIKRDGRAVDYDRNKIIT